MHRFFISKDSFAGSNVSLRGEAASRIFRVLRLKPGDRIKVLDDTGWEYETVIESITREVIQGAIVHKTLGTGEPDIRLTLYQALLKSDKFEFVLQKGVELGVTDFVPFASRRCVVRKPSENKMERWRNIIREAAEQSRRSRLPVLHDTVSFKEACARVNLPAVILWEGEKSRGITVTLRKPAFKKTREIGVFVGPEGGFSPDEIEFARQNGIVPVGLGKRILRAETAGLAVVSAIMYEIGELG